MSKEEKEKTKDDEDLAIPRSELQEAIKEWVQPEEPPKEQNFQEGEGIVEEPNDGHI